MASRSRSTVVCTVVVPKIYVGRFVAGQRYRYLRSYWYRLYCFISAPTFCTYVGLVAYPAFQIWYRNWSALLVYPNAGAYRLFTTRNRPWSRNESVALA